jgi:hypothetical protein
MDVDDLWVPLLPDARQHPGFHHVEHVCVPVVVVPDVFLVELRERRHLVGGPHVGAVPVGDEGHPVRIQRGPEDGDDVVADGDHAGLVAGYQVVRQLNGVLHARHLGGVETAAEVHDGPAGPRELPGLLVGQFAGVRQSVRDISIALHVPEVLRRGDDGHPPVASQGRPPHPHQGDPVRRRVQRLEVSDGLLVRRELEVGARDVPQDGLRGRDLGMQRRRARGPGKDEGAKR